MEANKTLIGALKQRIKELGMEARHLVEKRDQLSQRIHDIDIRLAHITGAMSEMTKMVKREEQVETQDSSKPTDNVSVPQADDVPTADDDSVQDKKDCCNSGCGNAPLRQPPDGFAG